MLNSCLTLKIISNNPSVRWYNSTLEEYKNNKTVCKVKWNNSKTENNWKSYVASRNLYKNKLRESESSFLQNGLTRNSDNPKKLWKTLKSIHDDNDKSNLTAIKFDDKLEIDPKLISDKLNVHFVSSIIDLTHAIPISNKPHMLQIMRPPNNFKFTLLSHHTV